MSRGRIVDLQLDNTLPSMGSGHSDRFRIYFPTFCSSLYQASDTNIPLLSMLTHRYLPDATSFSAASQFSTSLSQGVKKYIKRRNSRLQPSFTIFASQYGQETCLSCLSRHIKSMSPDFSVPHLHQRPSLNFCDCCIVVFIKRLIRA